jgi:monoamine oxidase
MVIAPYDCIIVGAGISGLYCGLEIQKKHPKWSVLILEKYKEIGGRTYTYYPPKFKNHWEAGAGRISKDHKKLLKLIDRYNLTLFPISSGSNYIQKAGDEPRVNDFEDLINPMYIQPLLNLSQKTKQTHTIYELMKKIYGSDAHSMVAKFPYWAEIYSLRADLALEAFTTGEMKTAQGYYVIKEGFGELIQRMRKEFETKGGRLMIESEVTSVAKGDDKTTDVSVLSKGKNMVLHAKMACILALHVNAVKKMKLNLPILNYLKPSPLFRIYAIFPKPVWFKDMIHLVTDERPRYIIPIDHKNGVIMISYTDGDDTIDYHAVYSKGGDEALQKMVMADIRKLLPTMTIPDPLFFKGHYWMNGCTYWQPGNYDVYRESEALCHPLPSIPNLYMCGESFSTRQAWVEGALDHSDLCLKLL